MSNLKYTDRVRYMHDSAMYMRGLFDNMTDPTMKSFGGGAPAREALPMKYMEKIASEVLSDSGRGMEAFQYSAPFGLYDLREAVCDHLLKPTGIEAKPENVQIVSGGLETMCLACELFIKPGDVIITEAPTFLHVTDTFNMFQAKIVPAECDDGGMIIEDVEKKIKEYDAKMVYIVPTFNNPTGRTLSVERRKALAELGSKYNIVILEDDPYRDVRYSGEVMPAIRSFDKTGNTIMACSFSKIFAPGARLGYAVADEDVIYALRDVKIATNSQPPGVSEVLCAEFFKRGFYEENLKNMCEIYKERRDVMTETMDRCFPKGVKRTQPDGGYYVWVTFPEGFDCAELQKKAEEKKFTFLAGGEWFPHEGDRYKNTARFNFTTLPPETIKEGIETIGAIACEMLGE
ncbi:MAG: PLP-dependent aminotransferase family protein [Anaerovoracaceae bacterium]|jgi:2-aminoadipate transaminase